MRPSPQEAAVAAVFVDSSGRRARLLRLAGMLVGVLCLSYAAVLGKAFTDWGGSPLAPTNLPPLGCAADHAPNGGCSPGGTPPRSAAPLSPSPSAASQISE